MQFKLFVLTTVAFAVAANAAPLSSREAEASTLDSVDLINTSVSWNLRKDTALESREQEVKRDASPSVPGTVDAFNNAVIWALRKDATAVNSRELEFERAEVLKRSSSAPNTPDDLFNSNNWGLNREVTALENREPSSEQDLMMKREAAASASDTVDVFNNAVIWALRKTTAAAES